MALLRSADRQLYSNYLLSGPPVTLSPQMEPTPAQLVNLKTWDSLLTWLSFGSELADWLTQLVGAETLTPPAFFGWMTEAQWGELTAPMASWDPPPKPLAMIQGSLCGRMPHRGRRRVIIK